MTKQPLTAIEIKRVAGRHFQDISAVIKVLGKQLNNAYTNVHDQVWVAFDAEPELRRIGGIIAAGKVDVGSPGKARFLNRSSRSGDMTIVMLIRAPAKGDVVMQDAIETACSLGWSVR